MACIVAVGEEAAVDSNKRRHMQAWRERDFPLDIFYSLRTARPQEIGMTWARETCRTLGQEKNWLAPSVSEMEVLFEAPPHQP